MMATPTAWWRKIDPDLITPYRILIYGLDSWDAALTPVYDAEDLYAYTHHVSIDIWRTRYWIRELGPRLDQVLHEFTAFAQGIARRGTYRAAASMHELAYRLLDRWLEEIEDRIMFFKYQAYQTLFIPPEFYEYSHENPTQAAFESVWDGEMRVWSPPPAYDGGKVELKWQDIREYFDQAIENGREAPYCPAKDEFLDMKLALQQEVSRAYARRVELRALRSRHQGEAAPPDKSEPPLPVRKRLRPAESTVLEVIAESQSRLTRLQIMSRLEERSKLLGESTVKAALGTLTTLGYIDNRQDVEPPGYAVTSMYPGIDFPD